MRNVVAMILAGGRGERMDILCHDRPKPALPFAGGLRVIDFSLSNCIHSQLSNIAVLVDYKRQYISTYLQAWRRVNASDKKFHILGPQNGCYKGTADAIYQNLDYLLRHGPEAVLVLAGDHVYRMDYRKILAFHEQMEADVTVGVVSVPIEQAHRFGITAVDNQGRITDFAEKPMSPVSNLASMGIYIFNRKVLVEHLFEDSTQSNSSHDFGQVIVPRMVRQNKVFAYQFDDYWQDIGTLQAYYEANMELIRELPSLSVNGKWPIFTTNNIMPPPEVIHEDGVKRSLISPGCVIKGRVENSILSPGVIVEEQAVVRNSVIMANTMIGKHSVVDYCILDEDVNVGKFCYIGFGASPTRRNAGITALGKGVKVPSYSAIYSSCKVSADTRPINFVFDAVTSSPVIL